MATQTELAQHLDLSQQSVSRLVADGVLPPRDFRTGYDPDACRLAYIRHLRGIASGRDSSRVGSLEAERARLAAAQAEAAERKNAKDRGELVSLPDVMAATVALVTLTRNRLQRVGAQVARGDTKLRKRIEEAVNDALEELARTNVVEAADAPVGEEGGADD